MAFFKSVILAALLAVLASEAHGKSNPKFSLKYIPLNKPFFKWEDCGKDTSAAKITKFSLSPDPVMYGNDATIDIGATLQRDVTGPVKVAVTMDKESDVSGLIRLRCEQGKYGSCEYEDICPLLKNIACDDKGSEACHCPFKKGTYSFTSNQVPTKMPFPASLAVGNYYVVINVSDQQGEVACIKTQFQIDS